MKLKRLAKSIYVKKKSFELLKHKDKSTEYFVEVKSSTESGKMEEFESGAESMKAQALNKILAEAAEHVLSKIKKKNE